MLDTNILISIIFYPSGQTKTFTKYLSENHTIVLCDHILEELQTVVKRKFPGKTQSLERFLQKLTYELCETPEDIDTGTLPIIRDQNDMPILTAAIYSGADYFITGDKDFLVLELTSPKIATISEFLEDFA